MVPTNTEIISVFDINDPAPSCIEEILQDINGMYQIPMNVNQ